MDHGSRPCGDRWPVSGHAVSVFPIRAENKAMDDPGDHDLSPDQAGQLPLRLKSLSTVALMVRTQLPMANACCAQITQAESTPVMYTFLS